MKPHFEIIESFYISGRGIVITGRTNSIIHMGDKLTYNDRTVEVIGIEIFYHHKPQSEQPLGLLIRGKGLKKEDFTKGQIWYINPKDIDWDKYYADGINLEDVDTYILLLEIDGRSYPALKDYSKPELIAELASRIDKLI